MSHNTLLHRLVRPAIASLAKTGATPNQLTTLRLATGVLAAVAFAVGRAPWTSVGAGVMIVSMLLDRADGELARATGKTSRGGYRYDLMADGASTVAVFLGMGVGARGVWGGVAVVYGALAAAGVMALFLLTPLMETRRDAPADRPFDPDDALLTAPLLVLVGLMAWTVCVAAIVAPLAAITLAGLTFWKRREGRFVSPA